MTWQHPGSKKQRKLRALSLEKDEGMAKLKQTNAKSLSRHLCGKALQEWELLVEEDK